VLIPDDNTKDLAEIPDNIKEKLDIRSVKWIDEVLQVALTHLPVALPAPPDPVKPAEVIAGEKPARKPGRAKGQVRAH
jgi:ATP-dependent Lon protease